MTTDSLKIVSEKTESRLNKVPPKRDSWQVDLGRSVATSGSPGVCLVVVVDFQCLVLLYCSACSAGLLR